MSQRGSKKARRIKQISVINLFGIFRHVIPLNLDERITIIHGPNGFGKTIILRLLNDLFSGKNSTLRAIPFNEFRVEFEDGDCFWVAKTSNDHKFGDLKQSQQKITTCATLNGVQTSYELKISPQPPITHISGREQFIRELEHLSDRWSSTLSNEFWPSEEVIDRLSLIATDVSLNEKDPDWLNEIKNSVTLRFIETQRLLNIVRTSRHVGNEGRMRPTVKEYSEDLAEKIKSTLAKSVELSQSLDSTFPSRVVNFTTQHALIEETLRRKLQELEDKRARLTKVGLLDQESSDVQYREIDDRTRLILSVYVEDVEKKLAVFDEIANKIDLLTRIINKRFSSRVDQVSLTMIDLRAVASLMGKSTAKCRNSNMALMIPGMFAVDTIWYLFCRSDCVKPLVMSQRNLKMLRNGYDWLTILPIFAARNCTYLYKSGKKPTRPLQC